MKPEDVSHFQIYTMRDAVIDGETAISDEAQEIQKQDIHAKIYMIRKYSSSDLYLGSLNASHNAVYGNIEFMIRLRSKGVIFDLTSLQLLSSGRKRMALIILFRKLHYKLPLLRRKMSRRRH